MLTSFMSLVLFFSVHQWAPKLWAGESAFKKEMSLWAEACFDGLCTKPYDQKTIYRLSENNPIDTKLKKEMERVAYEQAQVWGDTILEGDYVADGRVRLDRIYSLYKNKKHIGYRVTYSEKAWDISDCRYDGINDDTLADCAPGRIVETSYVSLDFKEYFYDDYSAARFR